jgi:undecaprenyl diphosphate synthase
MANNDNLILPTCLGFIMDGNRRFAREHNLEVAEGHLAGKDKLKEVIRWTAEAGVPHLVVYAFSTENWRRSETEVAALLSLFSLVIAELEARAEKDFAVRFIGRRSDFSPELQAEMAHLENTQPKELKVTVWIALSYGGRAEIVEAANRAIALGEKVDEESFAKLLWTNGMPDPDLLVRTGGEERLSNFLPWQSVYSELIFTKTYWPAFTKEEFTGILETYAARERRRGK